MKRFVQENVKPRPGIRVPPGASQHGAAGPKVLAGVPLNSSKKNSRSSRGMKRSSDGVLRVVILWAKAALCSLQAECRGRAVAGSDQTLSRVSLVLVCFLAQRDS